MRSIQRPDQYLTLRGDIWYYVRRVPKSVNHIDEPTLIFRSLETDSRKVTRQRRDKCAGVDDQHWSENKSRTFWNVPPHLMGCRNPRSEYGDGGSLTYCRDEMLKTNDLEH